MRLKKSVLTAAAVLLCMLFVCGVCAEAAVELINGSFEAGTKAWQKKAYVEEGVTVELAGDPERGSVAHIAAETDNDVRLIQNVSVQPNTAYKLSCYVKTAGVEGGAGACLGVYGIAVSSQACTGDTDWHYIELVGKTADNQKELAVSVGIGSHGAVSKGEAWFDDVKIEPADNASVMFGKNTAPASQTGKKTDREVPTEFPTKSILTVCAVAAVFTIALAFWHFYCGRKPMNVGTVKGGDWHWVLLILALALVFRIVISLIVYCYNTNGNIVYGHKVDVNDFIFWGNSVAQNGISKFYEGWCDYPPGYMLILGLMSGIRSMLGISSPYANALFIKIPCIIADLACAYIVYRISRKTMRRSAALALMALCAFTPVFAYISSGWGQIDQVLALMLIVPILLLYRRHPIWAGLIYGCGILMKPQALMCGPLFAAAYLIYVFKGLEPYDGPARNRRFGKMLGFKQDCAAFRFIETIIAVLAAVGVIAVVGLMFSGYTDPETGEKVTGIMWLIEKYYKTATSYNYATVNAYNYWAAIGANWAKTDVPYAGLTYGEWGTIGMAVSVMLSLGMYVYSSLRHKNCKGSLPLIMAFMLAGIFTFGHFMHERYVFPALMLLLVAYILYNDWRILVLYVLYSISILVNCMAAFYYSALHQYGLYWDNDLVFADSIVNIALFALLALTTLDLVIRNKPWKSYNG